MATPTHGCDGHRATLRFETPTAIETAESVRSKTGPVADDGSARQSGGADGAARTSSSGRPTEPFTPEDVTIVMATYNEEAAIGPVLDEIEAVADGAAEVVCVDGSSDRTPAIARERGATVIRQRPQGYGVALKEGLLVADRPVVLTADCDGTYPLDRLPDFLDALNEGADVASADRLSHGAPSMPALNRLGNRAFAAVASLLCARRVRDVTTGMRAYRREVIRDIEWTENTGLSAELLLRPVLRGYRVVEIPIDYRDRLGRTTLDPIRGGAAIAGSIVRVIARERLRSWRG